MVTANHLTQNNTHQTLLFNPNHLLSTSQQQQILINKNLIDSQKGKHIVSTIRLG